MKETKAYKTHLDFASGATPPKMAQKFKKPASPQLSIVPISSKEPTKKSKRVKRSAKKSTMDPTRGVVIRETLEMPLSKKKEKVDVGRVRRKSLRDFHKTNPSGSGTVTKTVPSAAKIKPSVTNKGIGVKPGVLDVTEEESSERDDEEEEEDEFVRTPSNNSDNETKIFDKAKCDEDGEMDCTTSQLYDDVDIRLNKPVQADDETKTEVPITSSSYSSDLASKFLNFLDIPHTDAEIISPMDVHVHHEVPIKMNTELLNHAILAKESFQPQSSYEAAALLTEFELKKFFMDKIDKSKSYLAAPEHKECYEGRIKSYEVNKNLFSTYDKVYSLKVSQKDKDKDEDPSAGSDQRLKKRTWSQSKSCGKLAQSVKPEFKVADSDMPQNQEENPGKNDEEPKTPQQGPTQSCLMTLASFADKPSKTFDELMSTPIDFSVYIMNSLKITNITQETLLGPAFRLQRKLQGIEDMVPNIWSPVKVAYDKHALWGISHWRDQLTRVEVMRKDRYGYFREIKVRRTDNDLYTFKEGDFPRLCINDIEDMLILIVYNRLTNLLCDDVSDFAIALRMFTRSIVI
uniref:Uncharacterized protein n=1 Tax=Tanacetum cinerariifolium TaxID=118510 RepID=A0A6L2LP12_TANCI|nr:hypothetical protein [Tanacetum cinerariifolium]